jgi:RNA-binding protein 26
MTNIQSSQGIGEFTDIQTTPALTHITFKDRKTAEKFMYGLSNKEIPGVDGQVELSWASNTSMLASSSSSTSKSTADRNTSKSGEIPHQATKASDPSHAEDVTMSGETTNTSGDNEQSHYQQQEQSEMVDYDVADGDDPWGN